MLENPRQSVSFKKRKLKSDYMVVGFDTEDDSNGNCHLLMFYTDKQTYTFYNNIDALYWLCFAEFPLPVLLWCINTEYDINNLVWPFNFLIDRMYNKTRFIAGTVYTNKDVRFLDVVNFYSLGAAEVGKIFGLEKLHFDFKHRKDKAGKIIVTKREKTYCERDATIAHTAGSFIISKFHEFDIPMSATVASSSLQIYLKHFDKHNLTQHTRNKYILDADTVYKSYFGGRCEVFTLGKTKEKLTYIDVNSLYPFVMRQHLYPNPISQVHKGRSADIENGVVSCKVRVPSQYLPVLPVRHNNKLMFPVGTFDGVWTVVELNHALNNGAKLLKVYESYEFEEASDLFSEYINFMYQMRHESTTKADNKFYKILMNALYGKFAERRHVKRLVPIEQGTFLNPVIGDMCVVEDSYLPEHNHTIVSAYVTAYGRILLHNAMMQILNAGGKLFYCDTDSIIFSGDLAGLSIGDELGQWKIEAKIDQADFRGPKFYSFRNSKTKVSEYRCKGVPASVQEAVFANPSVTYRKPIRYNESFRRKKQPNIWIEQSKILLTKYDKRRILQHGNTAPLVLNL